ncbi:2-C-methyl-D-erythritol 4-phosphate cytidylyltransferase [Enterobacter hormaechei]
MLLPSARRCTFCSLPLANHPQITVVDGGAERADSVLAGIQLRERAVGAGARCRASLLHHDDMSRLLALSETSNVGGILAAPCVTP